MVRITKLAWPLMLAAMLAGPGCRFIEPQTAGHGMLAPPQASAQSVTLEIFFARFAYGHPVLNGPLWDEIDEQAFAPAARRELNENGFRAGVVGNHVPVELARLLTLTDQARKPNAENSVDLEADPTVTLRLLQVRAGKPSEIVASSTYARLPLLMREAGEVVGRTYTNADGRFTLKASSGDDGRVRLDLLPELQHGDQQQRWAATDGVIRLDTAKPRRPFEPLRLKADLLPGQMLVLTCQPNQPGSLGHYFFTEPKADSLVQKVLIIRAAQAGSDRSFVEPAVVADSSAPTQPEP